MKTGYLIRRRDYETYGDFEVDEGEGSFEFVRWLNHESEPYYEIKKIAYIELEADSGDERNKP